MAATAQTDQLKTAAKQFEAIFLRQMIGAMRSASLSEDILSSSASDQFRDMADGRTADAMAEHSAIGIADMLLKQFSASVHATPAAATGAATGATAAAPATTADGSGAA